MLRSERIATESVAADEASATTGRTSSLPAWLKANFDAGNAFNAVNRSSYSYNVVEALNESGNKRRVDSYDPANGELVSRKYAQLGEVKPDTDIGYLQELARKVERGIFTIASAGANRPAEQPKAFPFQ